MAIVSVQELRHSYGTRVALDGVSFDVEPGECFGLLGPNGSGKSTLFKILTTLLPPTAGRAVIAGHDVVRDRSAARGQLGIVFQSPSLDIHLTVRENMIHAGRLYGLIGHELRARVDEMLAALGIADRAGDRVKTLSGGLKRRAELAKSLLHRPSVLILDEPSTGLDPRARKDLWQHVMELRRATGMTLLLTTHDMEEADRCDRLAILDAGRVVATGAPEALKRRLGGVCVRVETADDSLAGEIESVLSVRAVRTADELRIESTDGRATMSRILERFGSRIRSITLGQPTLEDVFVHETGRAFERAESANGVSHA